MIWSLVVANYKTRDIPDRDPFSQVGDVPHILRASSWLRAEFETAWLNSIHLALFFNPESRLTINDTLAFPAAQIISDHHLDLLTAQQAKIEIVCKFSHAYRLRALAVFAYTFYNKDGLRRLKHVLGPVTVIAQWSTSTAAIRGKHLLISGCGSLDSVCRASSFRSTE